MALRVVFMGTPAFAAATLGAVADAGHEIAAVYSQPPRPAGRRGLKMQPSAVAELASARGFEVRTPVSLKPQEEQARFRDLGADVAVVVAYGLILPKAILEGTRLGAYNGHASLLPRWRGAAPIQRAVMAGDEETGMMIMKMDEGVDTGPIALTRKVPIGPDTSTGELHDVLRDTGAELMVEALAQLEAGTLDLTPQPEAGATYAAKISKAETRIDWSLPAGKVHDHIRGLSPAPGAWCEWTRDGKPGRLKVLKASPCVGEGAPGTVLDEELGVACGGGAIRLERVQPAGAKAMDAAEFLKGNRLAPGDRL